MKKKKDPNRYPKRLNRAKVQALISHYENQTDAEAVAEAEAAYRSGKIIPCEIPVKRLAVRERKGRKRRLEREDIPGLF